jgi:hypothetical protein
VVDRRRQHHGHFRDLLRALPLTEDGSAHLDALLHWLRDLGQEDPQQLIRAFALIVAMGRLPLDAAGGTALLQLLDTLAMDPTRSAEHLTETLEALGSLAEGWQTRWRKHQEEEEGIEAPQD